MLVFLVEISVKYRILVVLETISGTDYRSTEILAKSSKYRFRSDISVSVGRCAAAGGREHKKSLILSKKINDKSMICRKNRQLFIYF